MRVEPVTKTVAEQIESEYREEDGQARKHRGPRRVRNQLTRIGEHVPPVWIGRANTETKVGKSCFRNDSIAHSKSAYNEDRADHVRHNLRDHDADIAITEHLGGLNISLFLQRKG